MKKYVLLLILVLFSASIFSQEKWTLQKCIQHALDNNIQIKSQEYNSKIHDINLQKAKYGILPGLNVGASENLTFGRNVDPYSYQFSTDNFHSANFQISSSVTLFSGLQQYNSIKKAEIDLEAGNASLEQTKNNVMLAVASAYLNVLYALDLVEIAEQQKEITELQLERTEKLVASGSLPIQSKYDVEAQLANEELNLVNYRNQYDFAVLNLAQLIEYEDFSNMEIQKPDVDKLIGESVLLSPEQIFDEAVNNLPQVKYAELNYLSSQKALQISKGAFYPSLTMSAAYGSGYSSLTKFVEGIKLGNPMLSGFATDNLGNLLDVYQYTFDYSYVNKPFFDQIKDNASTSVGFYLNIPIFNGLQTRSGVNSSKLYLEQAKLQVDQAKKDLFKEIQQAWSDAVSAMKKFDASEKAFEASNLSFEYTQKKYEQGLVNITDYNIAKNNVSRTQIEMLKSKYDFIFKQKILDFYRGLSFNF
jgi:outer membrane protein